ncbi:MAG: AAA family ATPase [Hyalangium sp.]|uniref:AAA family ATPase n=1 Tax=Hyalangium sp. TaxID=2028555 RepID=UPI00389A9BB2
MPDTSNSGHEQHKVPLDQLFLDPNNYRFIDKPDYVRVPQDKVFDADVQRRTMLLVLGERQSEVQDLIDSFKKNGWLPVDQIQVREMGPNRYLVIEGNRRVATLKYLKSQYENSAADLGALDFQFFNGVPVNLYKEADEVHHLILMGLKHVSGNKKWSLLNQAQMLRALHEEHKQSVDDIVKALGIGKREFNLSQNTLALSDLYRKSDYGDQFRSDQYNLFREIVKSPSLRDWLDWDYEQHKAGNTKNLERLFSWISTVEDEGEYTEEEVGTTIKRDPAITTGAQVRELAKIIDDEIALKNLEQTRSLSEATLSSGKVIKDRVQESLDRMEANSRTLLSMSGHADEKALARVDEMIRTLHGLQVAKGKTPRVVASVDGFEPFNKVRKKHLTELKVNRYRGLSDLHLSELRRVNIVAGFNNAGKTSVLEAIYLLSQQHDVDALFDVMRRRARLTELPPRWAYEQAPSETDITGRFDEMDARLGITCEQDDSEVADTSFYIGSIIMEAKYGNQTQTSRTHLFDKERDRVTSRQGQHALCKAVLSSPFSQHDPAVLARLYEESVKAKAKEQVLEFLRQSVDGGLQNIELANEFKRFLVTHRARDQAMDLSSFGEGMQRIFHMGMLFSWAQDGLVLIDEFENAIHAALLTDFTGFVQKLARQFNTQVFLTTHSKECIDAFVYNGVHIEDVGYYSLKREGSKTRSEYVSAEELQRMLEAADVDIRRLR